MRVTQFTTDHDNTHTTFSADFIFSFPYGGKRKKLYFWLQWFLSLLTTPYHALKYGVSVRERIWFRVPTHLAAPEEAHDAFFLLALPLACAVQEELQFDAPVSSDLLSRVQQVQEFYLEVLPQPIRVSAPARRHTKKKVTKKTYQCFTLGLDSFHSLALTLSQRPSMKPSLLYIAGYDVPFYEEHFLRKIYSRIQKVAAKTETEAVFLETNLREVSDAILGWGRFHVSALVAASTFLLGNKLNVSGESFDAPDWGLRTGVDTLYSRSGHQVSLIAHTVSRHEKVHSLLNSSLSEIFLKNIRVCWENVKISPVPYNCSQCQKCIKTQLTLMSCGVTAPPSFAPINVQALKKLQLVEHVFHEWRELYETLHKQKEVNPEILSAMQQVLEKPLRR